MNDISVADKPLVTFALFAYNQERYIREAVEAALAQSYEPLEIILSDDCSSDRTFEIIKEEADKYKGAHKIILNLNQENIGLASHVNKVMGLANGELIVVAAGDDISFSQRTSVLVEAWLAEGKPPAMCSQAIVISANGEKISDYFCGYDGAYPILGESRAESIKRLLKKDHCILLGCTEAWTQDVFKIFGSLGEKVIHEDNVISLRAWILGRIVYLSEPLIKYRTHDANIAYKVQRTPRSISDFKDRELEYAKRQRNKIINLQQHAIDINTAILRGLTKDLDLTGCENIIGSRIKVHSIRGTWWERSLITKLIYLAQCLSRKDFETYFWGLPRVLGLNVFSGGRACVALASRTIRRFFDFYRLINESVSKNINKFMNQ